MSFPIYILYYVSPLSHIIIYTYIYIYHIIITRYHHNLYNLDPGWNPPPVSLYKPLGCDPGNHGGPGGRPRRIFDLQRFARGGGPALQVSWLVDRT
jgi:hypothetical protein